MSVKKSIDGLLNKEMDRKEFLAHMGAATLGIIGISGLIKNLTDPHEKGKGYGSWPYGGRKKRL